MVVEGEGRGGARQSVRDRATGRSCSRLQVSDVISHDAEKGRKVHARVNVAKEDGFQRSGSLATAIGGGEDGRRRESVRSCGVRGR